MNTLRNIYQISTRTFNLWTKNGQNALLNLTQQPVDGVHPAGSALATPNGNVHLQHLSTKPNVIPISILEATNFKCKNLTSNFVPSGTLSPTAVKRLRQQKVELVYLCKICNTRNFKEVSAAAYTNGIVILQCDGCSVNHLICDNLGWFADTRDKDLNFEQVLAERAGARRIKIIKMNEHDEVMN